jgi:hypothetical protein
MRTLKTIKFEWILQYILLVYLVKLYKNIYFLKVIKTIIIVIVMSALNFRKGLGLDNVHRRKLSSFAECWKGMDILVGIWAVIYFVIAVATGNIM